MAGRLGVNLLSDVGDAVSYLRTQFKLDLVHEDESVGVTWLWPAQEHPVLVALPGHRARYVVSLFWRTEGRKGL